MSDAMNRIELLSAGQRVALGATHAENAGGFRQPTWAEQNPTDAATALIRASAAGRVELSPTVGVPDPVEDYFERTDAGLIQRWVTEQRDKGLSDDISIKLPDGTKILFGEYRKIAEAVRVGAVSGQRVKELVREARRAAAPLPPEPRVEPQPAPPADWRDKLPPEQREWIIDFSGRLGKDTQTVFQGLQLLIETIDSGGVVPGIISAWPGSKAELRATLIKIGEDLSHRIALEKAAGDLGEQSENEGTILALRFIEDFRRELQRQYPNNVGKQREAAANLRSKLRKLDALGFSPDGDLIPNGVDIGVLLQYLRQLGGGNEGV